MATLSQSSLFDSAPLPDVCRKRHKGNPESEAANRKIQSSKAHLQERILNWIRCAGSNGATCKEISRGMGLAYTTASARLSELKQQGRIYKTRERREDAAVLMVGGE